MSPAELRRLGEVLREMEDEGIELASAIAAVRLLVLTGCRLNEILRLKWEHVDIEARALRLPDSKTGAKTVHLGQSALDVLKSTTRQKDNEWVVTGTLPKAPLNDLQPFGSGFALGPDSRMRAFMIFAAPLLRLRWLRDRVSQ